MSSTSFNHNNSPKMATATGSASTITGGAGAAVSSSSNGSAAKQKQHQGSGADRSFLAATAMSTSALETKLRKLREDSQKHSQILTQKLASSQSGQNLLHIGTSLSTLPPDLHSLLTNLHPFLAAAEDAESSRLQALTQVVQSAQTLRHESRRIHQAEVAAELYSDLIAAENSVSQQKVAQQHQQQQSKRGYNKSEQERILERIMKDSTMSSGDNLEEDDEEEENNMALDGGDTSGAAEELDQVASLERAANITLCLVQELHGATETVAALTTTTTTSAAEGSSPNKSGTSSPSKTSAGNNKGATTGNGGGSSTLPTMRQLEPDSEKAQFVLQLAPRIRRLEADTLSCLGQQMESVLKRLQQLQEEDDEDQDNEQQQQQHHQPDLITMKQQQEEHLLFLLGHVMRGMVLLGRGKDVESIFARVAIMPLVRSKISMGRLDEGGSRGECAGLVTLLDEMLDTVHTTFGSVLRLSETMFATSSSTANSKNTNCCDMDVDLMTAGVWSPIATALMADAGIKMAIFSPGIANILQANYTALDKFLSHLSERLLKDTSSCTTSEEATDDDRRKQSLPSLSSSAATDALCCYYYRPTVSGKRIQEAQDRIYSHPKTAEFTKKWNLPIYYQLRFGECCARLNRAVEQTKREGWIAQAFTGSDEDASKIKHDVGFELSLFLELYDTLLGLWKPDVIIRPLTNRFLRGAVQLIGRIVAFVGDGMDGTIKFGYEPKEMSSENNNTVEENGNEPDGTMQPQPAVAFPSSRSPYCWGDSEQDVAAVAWELTILDSCVRHDYVDTVCMALADTAEEDNNKEIRGLVEDMLKDASDQIYPQIDKAWNQHVVNILTAKCSAPLAAVKGVAATYRMTNRPPPTQASPFVSTILRPLKEFSSDFENRTPDRVGSRWKHQVVVTIADRYAVAVEELLQTVQRTEIALTSRRARARNVSGGGLRDGEKVKLQLYLDYEMFSQSVEDVGVDPATVIGLSKLRDLTAEGLGFVKQRNSENGT